MKAGSPLLISAAFVLIFCTGPLICSQEPGNLGQRITDYWRSRSCTASRCKNPILVANARSIKVVRFDEKYAEEYVKPDELEQYLQTMPLSAWPQGPRTWVWESDNLPVPPGENAAELETSRRNLWIATVHLCRELGLTPTTKDGRPLQQR